MRETLSPSLLCLLVSFKSIWLDLKCCAFTWFLLFVAIAIKESATVGDQTQKRVYRGVDDLDFYIGDEAFKAPNYAVKVGE